MSRVPSNGPGPGRPGQRSGGCGPQCHRVTGSHSRPSPAPLFMSRVWASLILLPHGPYTGGACSAVR